MDLTRIEWTFRRSPMGSARRGDRRKSDVVAAQALVVTALSVVWPVIGAGTASAAPLGDPTLRDLIGALERREKTLGFRKTKNFRSHSSQSAADCRCYYIGKVE